MVATAATATVPSASTTAAAATTTTTATVLRLRLCRGRVVVVMMLVLMLMRPVLRIEAAIVEPTHDHPKPRVETVVQRACAVARELVVVRHHGVHHVHAVPATASTTTTVPVTTPTTLTSPWPPSHSTASPSSSSTTPTRTTTTTVTHLVLYHVEGHGHDEALARPQVAVVLALLHESERGHVVHSRVAEAARLRKAHAAELEVVERALRQDAVLLVVHQQVVPERVARQNLGVAHDDHAVLGARECYVEPTWVVEEADALLLAGAHARQDDEVLLAALVVVVVTENGQESSASQSHTHQKGTPKGARAHTTPTHYLSLPRDAHSPLTHSLTHTGTHKGARTHTKHNTPTLPPSLVA